MYYSEVRTGLVLAMLLGLTVATGASIAGADSATLDKIGQPAVEEIQPDNDTDSNSEYGSMIIEFRNDSIRDRISFPENISVKGGQDISFMPVLFAEGPANAFETFEERSGVVDVRTDTRVEIEPPQNPTTSESTPDRVTVASQSVPWGIDRISAQTARETVSDTDIGRVDVAILDTGIDYTHNDIETVSWGANFSKGVEQYGRSTALDNNGHGTAVSGVVGAADDTSGVVGVSPGVDMYAIKVMNENGAGRLSWVLNGIDVALKGADRELGTEDDAEVLSLSLGTKTGDESLQQAVNAASDHAVVVAAAGNSGDGDASTDEVEYPGRYNGAIAVAATNRMDETWLYSAEGDAVELAAPGVAVTTTNRGGGTTTVSGTSIATPHVAGTAALVIADDYSDGVRDLSPDGVRTQLQNSALDIEVDGVDKKSGHGLVIATQALENEPAEEVTFSVSDLSPGNVSITQNGTFDISATITNTGTASDTQTVQLRIDGSQAQDQSIELAAGESTTASFNGVDTTPLEPGPHSYSIITPADEKVATLLIEQTMVEIDGPTAVSGTQNSTINATYTVRNTGSTHPSAGGLRVLAIPDQLSVQGPDTYFLGFEAPVPAPGESLNRSFQYAIPDGAASGEHPVTVEVVVGDANDSMNTTVHIRPSLDRFDRNEPYGDIDFQDVLDTINSYNSGETVGGHAVSFQDVLSVVEEYNIQ